MKFCLIASKKVFHTEIFFGISFNFTDGNFLYVPAKAYCVDQKVFFARIVICIFALKIPNIPYYVTLYKTGTCLICFQCGITTSSGICNRTQTPVQCDGRNKVCTTIRYYENFKIKGNNKQKYTFMKECMEKAVCKDYCSLLPFDTVGCLVSILSFDR